MDIFATVKAAVTVRQAAEHYGLQVSRNGMTCCPFHDDRHPSMKLNERYFYCFGCGATGDVIDLVARLFNLSNYEAAQKLAHDFEIDPDKPPAAIALPKPERPLLRTYRQEEVRCLRVLCDYLHLLERWKVQYAPKTAADIEAHNERTKEKYASNPDVDISRSKYNFHLIEPERKYRAEAERQIKEAGCRTRSDSVRVVEALVTATPEFFQGKKKSEIRAYFQEALAFLQQNC